MAPNIPKSRFNARTITMPIAAFTMATILFVYTRTSINAAKRNARLHREADGGQINWHNESLRRHGKLEPPEEQVPIKQLAGLAKESVDDARARGEGKTDAEERLRERAGKGR